MYNQLILILAFGNKVENQNREIKNKFKIIKFLFNKIEIRNEIVICYNVWKNVELGS